MYFSFGIPGFIVLLGVILMLACIVIDYLALQKQESHSTRRLWQTRIYFLSLFSIIYFIVFLQLSFTYLDPHLFHLSLSILLLAGSLFVFFEGRVMRKRYHDINQSQNALADANVNMAMLYAKLEAMKVNLELQKNELSKANLELKETQDQLVQIEKMAALGQLVAGIGHEINTPMGAINASSENITDILNNKMIPLATALKTIEDQDFKFISTLLDKSMQAKGSFDSREERAKRRHIESELEKHQVPNSDQIAEMLVEMHFEGSTEEILSILEKKNAMPVLTAAHILAMIYENCRTIDTSSKKIKKIIFSLKSFAHFTPDDKPQPFELKKNIETVLTLYQNQIKHDIELVTNFDSIGDINLTGYPDELGQVWTNLIHNALQAMEYKGRLGIEIKEHDDHVKITFTDSGKGVPEEIRDKIFLPFFTTKNRGEGSGLGLYIVKKIVEEKEHGQISMHGEPGKTCFVVELPKAVTAIIQEAPHEGS
jgi:two-component system NtrC family sensor kinase